MLSGVFYSLHNQLVKFNRWQKIGLVLVFISFLALIAFGGYFLAKSLADPTATTAGKPNIVFVLVDDMDRKAMAYMPKVKSLIAEKGTTFENYFYNIPQCCPSRAAMLRGQYSHTSGLQNNGGPDGGFDFFYQQGLEDSTFATWLQDTGYGTFYAGKYMNGYLKSGEAKDDGSDQIQEGTTNESSTIPDTHVPKGWSSWHGIGQGYGGYNYTINNNGTLDEQGKEPTDYATDVISAKAQEYLASEEAGQKPFLLVASTFAPHAPFKPAERHKNLFNEVTYPRNPNFNEADVSDKSSEIKDLELSDKFLKQVDEDFRNRIRSLQAVDEMVEGIVNTLEKQGKLDNTYLVFGSDNGFHMGEHRLRNGKLTAFEEDIRVPLIISGPGVPVNQKITQIVGNIDIAPTFAALAGAKIPDFVDGRSLLPLLNDPNTSWRNAYLIRRTEKSNEKEVPLVGIRTSRYTYLEYDNGLKELYDLRNDPFQLTNIAPTASETLLASLKAAVDRLKACRSDECRSAENLPIE